MIDLSYSLASMSYEIMCYNFLANDFINLLFASFKPDLQLTFCQGSDIYLVECVDPSATLALTHAAKLCGAGFFFLGRLLPPSRTGGLLSLGRPPTWLRLPDSIVLRREIAVGWTGILDPLR